MNSVFASIGLAKLVPALGLRQNTKEYIPVKHLDENASGCYSCAHYSDKMGCENCPSRQYYTETKVRYINEKHRFGYEEVGSLKKYALLLYMRLHFLFPDQQGYISKIDPEELSKQIGCTTRTVINNLNLLNDKNFIYLGKHEIPGYYKAFIADYKDIYKKAPHGGRGFLRIGADLMDKITSLTDTNAIRLAIRSYLNCIEFADKPQLDKEKSIRQIKSVLPEYVTKKKLFSLFENDTFKSIFKVSAKSRSATILVLPEFNQSAVAEQVKDQCRQDITSLIDTINKESKVDKKKKNYRLILNDAELRDIVNISLKLPVVSILEGIKHFYNTYVTKNLAYERPGAIIRSFAQSHMENGLITG